MSVQILSSRRLLEGFVAVDEATLTFRRSDGSNSKPVKRISVERGDSAACLLYHPGRDAFLLARQFRYPTMRFGEPWLTEIVAGKIDEGESPEEAIRREIEEEVGHRAGNLVPVATFYPSPGAFSERIFVFYAEITDDDCVADGGGVDEEEDVEKIWMDANEAIGLALSGGIHDGKTILALMWAENRRLRGAVA